jgi:PIN domain nuclease of toxin-antitoxin system
MTYVTDTHALVFFASGEAERMSRNCVRIFRRAEQERDRIHIPIICFFELALLFERRRVRSPLGFEGLHDAIAQFPGLPIEPLRWEDVREARGLAGLVDPFDRLIAGTAIRLEAPLITADERIRDSGLVRTVW